MTHVDAAVLSEKSSTAFPYSVKRFKNSILNVDPLKYIPALLHISARSTILTFFSCDIAIFAEFSSVSYGIYNSVDTSFWK